VEVVTVDVGTIRGASWGRDDGIVFARDDLWRVPATGGTPELIEHRPEGGQIFWPQVLDHGMFLYSVLGSTSARNPLSVVLRSADGSKRTLVTDAMQARYVEPGYLVFGRGSTIMAAKLDLRRPEAMSAPMVVKDGVSASWQVERFYSRFSVSARGSLAYAPGQLLPAAGQIFSWMDRASGKETMWPFGSLAGSSHRLSPDGSFLAIVARDPASFSSAYQIWIGDFARGSKQKLGDAAAGSPAWTRDGNVVYRKTDWSIFLRPADLSAPERKIVEPGPIRADLDVSPDGKTLIWSENVGGNWALWVLTGFAEGATKPRLFRDDGVDRINARLSPDGRWIAYTNESGKAQGVKRTMQVEPFPGPGPIVTVSVDTVASTAASAPAWRNNELLWLSESGDVVAVTYTATPRFIPSAPRVVLKKPADASVLVAETSPDGRRFALYRREPPATPPSQINIVLNWIEELKRRVR